MYKPLMILLLAAFIMSGCAVTDGAKQNAAKETVTNSNATPEPNNEQLPIEDIDPQEIASDVINLLKDKDMPRLAAYVHPTEGVRFSPYGYVNKETDIIMQAVELQNAFEENNTRVWGSYDGTGDPITLSFADYYDKFVYDRDFANAERVGYNETIGHGNSLINTAEIYPGSFIVEYHFKGTEAYNEMDWSSLRIVLVQHNGDWVVSGIIHDQWTI
jgi:hypothetical protein